VGVKGLKITVHISAWRFEVELPLSRLWPSQKFSAWRPLWESWSMMVDIVGWERSAAEQVPCLINGCISCYYDGS